MKKLDKSRIWAGKKLDLGRIRVTLLKMQHIRNSLDRYKWLSFFSILVFFLNLHVFFVVVVMNETNHKHNLKIFPIFYTQIFPEAVKFCDINAVVLQSKPSGCLFLFDLSLNNFHVIRAYFFYFYFLHNLNCLLTLINI